MIIGTTSPYDLMILAGLPRGDHTDASGASLQLSLLPHALPPRHVLHSGQVINTVTIVDLFSMAGCFSFANTRYVLFDPYKCQACGSQLWPHCWTSFHP